MCKKQSNVTIKLSCGKNDVKKMNCVKCVWGGGDCVNNMKIKESCKKNKKYHIWRKMPISCKKKQQKTKH